MSDEASISTGEIARGVTAIRADIKDLAEKVEQRPDWQDVKRVESGLQVLIMAEGATRAAERNVADKAIKALEDWNSWALRIALGAVATGLIGWIFTAATVP